MVGILSSSTSHSFSGARVSTETCPTVRMDQTDSDVSAIPIWDEGQQPSCYVYSSSFLATMWIRKFWKVQDPALSSFVADPYSNFEGVLADPDKDQILDAENGRTCMSLAWELRTYQKIFSAQTSSSTEFPFPKCDMFGLLRSPDHETLRTPGEIKAQMQVLLGAKTPFPFAIEYCSGVLDGRQNLITNRVFDKTLTYLNSDQSIRNFSADCGFHVSVIVGQEKRDDHCEILIRNSWGREAGDNGYYWVDADALSANTLRVVSLQQVP